MFNMAPNDVFPGLPVRSNVLAKDCTSFRIGGPLHYFAEPSSAEELQSLLSISKEKEIPVYVIGNGSNILISDDGVDALFIKIGNAFSGFSFDGMTLHADAGALLSLTAKQSVFRGFAGLEWAAGIPGTIGGAVAMNAGAYGGEIKQVIKDVTLIEDGKIVKREVKDGDLGYRYSVFSYPNSIVIGASFVLQPDDGSAELRMNDYSARRREKQPLEYPSAGSTFKRPPIENRYAGALIEQSGLKGARIGNAMVSPKHAGFIINCGGATFNDVLELIEHVRKTVFERFGIMLEPEVKVIR